MMPRAARAATVPPTRPDAELGVPCVTDQGLFLPAELVETADVSFDNRRIWSVAPTEFAVGDDGLRYVPWPTLLLPNLDGIAVVSVREHHSQIVVLEAEHAFGTGSGRVVVAGKDGALRVIDKWGFTQRPFDLQGPELRQDLLDGAERILAILRDECGVPAWIAFGSLLGAVRDGTMIGHDSDVDLAYLSAYEQPADVAREMFRISRTLREHGMKVSTRTASFCAVSVPSEHGHLTPVDVYACFYLGDVLYETASVGAPVPRDALLPLGSIEFEGRPMPAPADPEVLLEASYGPSWRVPDPAFAYNIPRGVKRRFNGWFTQSMKQRRPWDRRYNGILGAVLPEEPSRFAMWVAPQLAPGAPVIDVGCGNGRDSAYFARHGHQVVGVDFSPAALGLARRAVAKVDGVGSFRQVNLYDYRSAVTEAALIARDVPARRTIYARFLLHQLERDGLDVTWRFFNMLLRPGGGRAFLEFRTLRDAAGPHHFEGFRRLLDPDDVVRQAKAAGARVVERIEDTGLAPFENEDPPICRLVLDWSR